MTESVTVTLEAGACQQVEVLTLSGNSADDYNAIAERDSVRKSIFESENSCTTKFMWKLQISVI